MDLHRDSHIDKPAIRGSMSIMHMACMSIQVPSCTEVPFLLAGYGNDPELDIAPIEDMMSYIMAELRYFGCGRTHTAPQAGPFLISQSFR